MDSSEPDTPKNWRTDWYVDKRTVNSGKTDRRQGKYTDRQDRQIRVIYRIAHRLTDRQTNRQTCARVFAVRAVFFVSRVYCLTLPALSPSTTQRKKKATKIKLKKHLSPLDINTSPLWHFNKIVLEWKADWKRGRIGGEKRQEKIIERTWKKVLEWEKA